MQINITTPGSKSISNRALFLSAFSPKPINLINLSDSTDTKAMIKGLTQLTGQSPIEINTGNAGTTTRFLTALSTLLGKEVTIDGDQRMRERPIKALVQALNKLGANIETKNDCPPVMIHSNKLLGGKVSLPGDISSQYLSAILLSAPFAEETTTITIEQDLCSKPYVSMTLKVLKGFGIDVLNKNFEQFVIEPQTPQYPDEFTIESDASSASYVGAYAALHPETPITIKNLNKDSIQGDIKFLEYLETMGCIIEENKGLQITGPFHLKPLGKVDMNETPDLVMTFAVLAAFANGETEITNIPNLRIKETDRLQALENELKKLSVNVETTESSIRIEGNKELIKTMPINETEIETYDDHRIAMSFAIAENLLNLKIKNPECVSKSYKTFWQDLKLMQNND